MISIKTRYGSLPKDHQLVVVVGPDEAAKKRLLDDVLWEAHRRQDAPAFFSKAPAAEILGLFVPASFSGAAIDNLNPHPAAIEPFFRALLEHISPHPDVCVVITTNNPYVLDAVAPASVLCLVGERLVPLTRHPKWEKHKGELAPGEFWASFGEPPPGPPDNTVPLKVEADGVCVLPQEVLSLLGWTPGKPHVYLRTQDGAVTLLSEDEAFKP